MKTRIFNSGKGWYISCTNYKDPNDKCYMNVGFKKGTEPIYEPTADSSFTWLDIDVINGKHNCYNGKPGFFVFDYDTIEHQDMDSSKFGATENNLIKTDDLPFY